jgi:hypothetical protein
MIGAHSSSFRSLILAVVTMFLTGGCRLFGQGTFSVKNLGAGFDQTLFESDGVTKIPKASGRIEILYKGSVITSVRDGTGNGFLTDGIFALGVFTLPDVPVGGSAVVEVRVWDNATGSTFATATSTGSELVEVSGLGGGIVLPANFARFKGFSLGCDFCGGVPAAPLQEIAFAPLPPVVAAVFPFGPIRLTATASSGLPVQFAVASGPATVADGQLTLTGSGSVTVVATQPGDGVWNAANPVSRVIRSRLSQTIFFAPQTNILFPNSVLLTAIASSGLPVQFLVEAGSASIRGSDLLVPLDYGTVTLLATQPGDDQWAAAPPLTSEITFGRPAAVVVRNVGTDSNQPVFRADGVTKVPKGEGRVEVIFNDQVVSPTKDGTGDPFYADGAFDLGSIPLTGVVSATEAAVLVRVWEKSTGATFATASATGAELVVVTNLTASGSPSSFGGFRGFSLGCLVCGPLPPAPYQEIAFGPLPAAYPMNLPMTLSATASSGLPVQFAVASGPASIAGDQLTITGLGVVTVVASQQGDAHWLAAPQVPRSFAVTLRPQEIEFPRLPTIPFTTSAIPLGGSASSGLPISYAVNGPAHLDPDGSLALDGVGPVTVVATQAGDAFWAPANPVTNTFTVTRIPQQIVITGPPAAVSYTNGYITVIASASSGGQIELDALGGLVSVNEWLPVAGRTAIVATQPGDSVFAPVSVTNFITVFSSVADRRLFYKNSGFSPNSTNNIAQGWADPVAGSPSGKIALRPGQKAGSSNYCNYSRGLNGLYIDFIPSLPGPLGPGDFEFVVGNDNNPAGWAPAPPPELIVTRVKSFTPADNRTRATLMWPDNVLSTTNTWLQSPDIFFFGNAVGDTFNSESDAQVDALDELAVRHHPIPLHKADLESPFDINRDGNVNVLDEALIRGHATTALSALQLIDLTGDPKGFVVAGPVRAPQPPFAYVALNTFELSSAGAATIVESAAPTNGVSTLWQSTGTLGPWNPVAPVVDPSVSGGVVRWTVPAAGNRSRFYLIRVESH